MRINLAANILNVILNSLFIYKLGYGVIGAAIASSISSVVAGLLMLVAVLKNSELRFTKKDIKPGKIRLNKTMEIALPALATGAASCLGYVAFARMVSGMGKTIFAAHSIAVAAEELFYMPGYGLRTATSALIGHALGEQDQKKMRQTEKVSIWINISIMVAGGILLFIFAEPMMRIFTSSDRVAVLGAKMLRLVAFSEPFFGLMIVYEGIFYGKGQTKGIFVIETFSMWAVRIFFTYMVVNVWKLGLTEVWYCMIADNVFKALALMIYYNKCKNR
jgi:putative MATE family efflux protein